MKKGGVVTSSKRAADVIRLGGFLLPFAYLLNAIFVYMHLIYSPVYSGTVALLAIMIPWILVGAYQFFLPSRMQLPNFIHLVLYHVFACLFVIFITGMSTPFLATWSVLALASYIYFKNKGMLASIVIFIILLVVSFFQKTDPSYILTSSLYAIATLAVSLTTIAVWSANELDNRELMRSREEGMLQRDRIVTIVNNIADAILATDRYGKVRLYNAATLNLLDTNANINGKSIDDLMKLHDSESHRFTFAKGFKEAKSVVVRDDLSSTISGEEVHLSVIYSPIRGTDSSKERDGYIVILRDITKQKSLEEERDEFISVVSHELRTPLTIAEGSLSNVQLIMDRKDVPKDTLAKSVNMAHDQMIFLARMVNDLSTLSRAERGVADTPEEIDVTAMIHDLYNEYSPEAAAKNLRLDLDMGHELGSVNASRLYLKELIQNFITNAIKYTKEGSILISVHRENDKVHFAVKDTGIGISKSDQARIFDKFYRSEDYRTRETGGTGLGLYVAHKLARKLHTRIELTSRLNHGSTFGFELPAMSKTKK